MIFKAQKQQRIEDFICGNKTLFKEANAKFKYRVGSISDSITVGSKASSYRSRDDWIVQLGISAAVKVSKKYNTDLSAVLINIDTISLSEEKKEL